MRAYLLYSRHRLGWYALSGRQALTRHWQWLLLAALIVPGVPVLPLLAGAAQPLAALVTPGLGWLERLALLVAVEAFAAAWALMQRRGLAGGAFAAYAATLPVPKPVDRLVDLTVLLVADLLPLLVFAVALAGSKSAASTTGIVALLALTLALQLLVLGAGRARGTVRHEKSSSRHWLRMPPALGVQLGIFAEHKTAVAMRLGAVVLVCWGALMLARGFRFDGRALPTGIAATAVIDLLLGGLYRVLEAGHQRARDYLSTLPLRPGFWMRRDTGLLLGIGTASLLSLLAPLVVGGAASVATGLWVLAGGLALLGALRWAVVRGGRFAPLLAAALAAGWTGAAIAAVLR